MRCQAAGPGTGRWSPGSPAAGPSPLCISGRSVPKERARFTGHPPDPPQDLQLLMPLSPQLQRDDNYYHYSPLNERTPYKCKNDLAFHDPRKKMSIGHLGGVFISFRIFLFLRTTSLREREGRAKGMIITAVTMNHD